MKIRFSFYSIIFFYMLFITSSLFSQNAEQKFNRNTEQYNSPFKAPSIDSIKKVLGSVRDYFYSGTPFKIIDKKTKTVITDFSTINQNADIDNGDHNLFNLWTYEMGVTYDGMMKASTATGDKKYLEYVSKSFKYFFDNLPYFKKIDSLYGETANSYKSVIRTETLDDCGSMGASLIKIYKLEKDPRYLPIINHIANHISKKQFRLSDGILARQRPQAKSIWLDDAYMSIPFLAQMGSLTGEKKYFDDAVKQVLLFSKYLYRKDKRLFDHGMNIHNQNDLNIYWARANGWIVLAINELLDVLPENYKDRNKVIKILRDHIQGLSEHQGGNGFWHNVLDRFDSYEETSATAMFSYGISHAINKGWCDQTFAPVAQSAWEAASKKVNALGQVEGTCVGTSLEGSEVYYYHRPTSVYAAHGYGPILLAGTEMIKLIENKNLIIKRSVR